MSAINKFANETEYNAHTKSTTNSEVSLVVTPKDLHYDGLNVENKHKIPAIGDCLYLDSNGKRHFFYGATVNNSKLVNDGYTPVGVVAHKYSNNKVLLINKQGYNVSNYCQSLIQKLSGYKTDGTANNIKVRWFNSSNVKTIIENTFTESCSSLQDFVTKFDVFLRANQVGSYQWHCELMQIEGNNEACVVIDSYTIPYQYQSVIESGAGTSIVVYDIAGVITNYRLTRNNGYSEALRVFINKEYSMNLLMNGKPSYSPTDDYLHTDGYLNYSDFNSGNYPNTKSYYKTYENYFNSLMMKQKPCLVGGQVEAEDGVSLCRRLKNITFKNINGVDTYLFPAIRNCSILTDGGLEWHLIDMNECYDIISKLDFLNLSDPINIALNNISNRILNYSQSYAICNCRPSERQNFISSYGDGATTAASLCNTYKCIPVSILDLN